MTKSREGHKQNSALHAMRAVLWGAVGIRSESGCQADINRLTMTQIIVAGIFGVVLFVMTLLLLVYFITK